jgi:hypothetical protein
MLPQRKWLPSSRKWHHPQNDLERDLGQDLKDYLDGKASALRVSDGAYIALRNKLDTNGETLTLGTALDGLTKCPACGQFVGQAVHNCPNANNANNVALTTPTATTNTTAASVVTTNDVANNTALDYSTANAVAVPLDTPATPSSSISNNNNDTDNSAAFARFTYCRNTCYTHNSSNSYTNPRTTTL